MDLAIRSSHVVVAAFTTMDVYKRHESGSQSGGDHGGGWRPFPYKPGSRQLVGFVRASGDTALVSRH